MSHYPSNRSYPQNAIEITSTERQLSTNNRLKAQSCIKNLLLKTLRPSEYRRHNQSKPITHDSSKPNIPNSSIHRRAPLSLQLPAKDTCSQRIPTVFFQTEICPEMIPLMQS